MKKSAILFLIILSSLSTFAQKPKGIKKTPVSAVKTPQNAGNEKEEFDRAAALTDAAEQITSLEKFLAAFPKSAEKIHALELITVARAQIGDAKFKNNEPEEGVKFFKLAVKDAPTPISDKLFTDILMQIPTNLFFRGQPQAALETAQEIEAKTNGNAKQTIGLAAFYLNVENAAEAQRLAEKALVTEPNLPAAYQTLGIAHRLNFELDDALNAYAKALELDENSTVSKRSLAEMNRAVGKSDEAVRLYRELLAKDAADAQSQTGLTLALFDADKLTEANAEMAKSLAQNANNLPLLVGAAYWYAAHKDGAKAVELASRATQLEPRYIWAQIALARGFILQNRPLEAERVLLAARQYGNFPTLNYELAAARLQAGFFREAAETLALDFTIKDDLISAKLGGRVRKDAKSFVELLAFERRAGIFQPLAADSPENAARMKNLLDFSRKIDAPESGEAAISQSADAFIEGADTMKLHRQLFVARQLLEKHKDSPKVSEIAQSAIGKADAALDVPNAAAAVLADALYDSRVVAAARNEIVVVPEVSRPTLSAILRGEIEEINGWAAYQQNKNEDAIVHLKRAVSVLPEKSSFWRSSMWRLGASLEADGKNKEALESYLKSYPTDAPSAGKYLIIESLYKKVNGSDEGLEAQIGVKPIVLSAGEEAKSSETADKKDEIAVQNANIPVVKTEVSPTPAETKVEQTAPVQVETPKETPVNQSENSSEKAAVKPEIEPKIETSKLKTDSPKIDLPKTDAQVLSKTPETNSLTVENKPAVIDEKTAPAVEKNDTKPAEQISPPVVQSENAAPSNKPKPLFEPIIIQVPQSENAAPVKPDVSETKPEKTDDKEDQPTTEKKDVPQKTGETINSGSSRSRVVITDNLSISPETAKCSFTLSQKSVTLINNGGSLALSVSFDNQSEESQITAVSDSPDDVSVNLDDSFSTLSNRSFFIVKSISPKAGNYKITFTAACGKKEIPVIVR